MREYLFRGKRIDNGQWIYGYYIKATHHWHNHGVHEDWIATDTVQNGGWCNVRGKYAVSPETIGQYTGLTDENGKKIFEGDIVRISERGESVNGKIIFKNAYNGGWLVADKTEQSSCCLALRNSVEVIGNIHDNPELLGGEL
jgi:uncharacterized phage protein (TIGR01671 family)